MDDSEQSEESRPNNLRSLCSVSCGLIKFVSRFVRESMLFDNYINSKVNLILLGKNYNNRERIRFIGQATKGL